MESGTGKVVVLLEPALDAAGHIVGFGRRSYGVSGPGLKLKAGHYRVVAVYHNTSGARILNGGMAMLDGIFLPDDARRWPALDQSNPVFAAAAAGLDRIGWVTVADQSGREPRRLRSNTSPREYSWVS